MNTEIKKPLEYHENMIDCQNGVNGPFLKKWAARMVAEQCGFVECTDAYERAMVAIKIAFQFGIKSSQQTNKQ